VTGAETAASCEALASHSDGLQVRHAADAIATWPTSAGVPTDCLGQAVTDAIVMNRFYAKASSSSGEPELYCEGNGGKQAQPVVEGIERMRVMVWLAGASAAVGVAAVGRDQWTRVVALDVCVVVRGFQNRAKRRASYADCDGTPATADDGRLRQAFWRRVAIRNLAASSAGGTP
jgi:type IV pilus assembly protein PilW